MVDQTVEEMAVVRYYDKRALVLHEVFFQKLQGHDVQIVRGLVEYQQVGLLLEHGQKVKPAALPSGETLHRGRPGFVGKEELPDQGGVLDRFHHRLAGFELHSFLLVPSDPKRLAPLDYAGHLPAHFRGPTPGQKAQEGRFASGVAPDDSHAVVALELEGGETFFGEPALNIHDWLTRDPDGRGMINILASDSLINNGRLYSTFLLWLLSELFETLPEVGDPDKPRLVFFFDEAHLLFNGASKTLLDKIEQVVKLIRSKGVGVYFCTQNPRDIPDGVLAQLGNKIEHGLRAYTPAEKKSIRAAADSFRENPSFDTAEAIKNLGTGEAVVSFLQEDGTPGMAQIAYILPPQSSLGTVTDEERERSINNSLLFSKYAEAEDPDSAYEFLMRRGVEIAEQKAQEAIDALAAKEAELKAKEEAKLEAARLKEEAKQKAAEEREAAREAARLEKEAEREREKKARVAKNAAKSVAGTLGREVGKTLGGTLGKTGKLLGGNLGATLGRGILDTLFNR